MRVSWITRSIPVVLALGVLAADAQAQTRVQTQDPVPGGVAAPAPASRAAMQPSEATLTAAAAEIQSLIDAGQGPAAAEAARDFARRVANDVGFGVTNARLTNGPASGFGVFEPRTNTTYAVNETVYAYVELFGFSLTPQESGANALVFDVFFTLDTPDGQQITPDLVPMGEIRLSSFSEPLDAYFHLTYSITGAEGAFDLRTRVVDRASGQSAEFVLPLEFTADPSDPAMPEADDDKRR